MTAVYLYDTIKRLEAFFDIVRLVDTARMEICNIDENGNITREEYSCFEVWKKHERCVNCISAKACMKKGRLEKFEFVNGDVYHVVSNCVSLDGTDYALELVTKTTDETLFEAYGKSEFVKSICDINQKMYVDSLTGLKNRRYYKEQKSRLDKADASALIDIDDFKKLNDIYGHTFGDIVLKNVADIVLNSVSKYDTVIRYGGDEIYIIFQNEKNLHNKLEEIKVKINNIVFPDKNDLTITISVGGVIITDYNDDPFEIADKKLYLAKKKKDCIVI